MEVDTEKPECHCVRYGKTCSFRQAIESDQPKAAAIVCHAACNYRWSTSGGRLHMACLSYMGYPVFPHEVNAALPVAVGAVGAV